MRPKDRHLRLLRHPELGKRGRGVPLPKVEKDNSQKDKSKCLVNKRLPDSVDEVLIKHYLWY